ncbi:indolethylamine N-methyltransferase-like [Spea bombifrons]|uniref:indolethylamine N-methyltransferase-like n=1 Tax=Spea bombifrons TaxID=233779 RepID=UPI0023499F01|nr:indolethylamine N-methyltransferase-like [Spea bombifrons]
MSIYDQGFNAKQLLQTLYSPSADQAIKEDLLYFPINKLHNAVASGKITGTSLVDISFGPVVYQILAIGEQFSDISVLKATDQCVAEVNAWLKGDSGAFDWSSVSKYIADLEGSRDKWEEKEKKVKAAVKKVLKYERGKQTIVDPSVVPKADCMISMWLNEVASTDREGFIRHLKKMSALIKLGGQLILFTGLNGTFLDIGGQRFNIFLLTEPVLKTALAEAGFSVTMFESKLSVPKPQTDVQSYAFITAMKVRLIKYP